jgi:hypothetical protein
MLECEREQLAEPKMKAVIVLAGFAIFFDAMTQRHIQPSYLTAFPRSFSLPGIALPSCLRIPSY